MKCTWPAFLFLLATNLSVAEDFCSLKVLVVDPLAGLKLSDVSVAVQERNGTRVVELTKDGVARFCGLGISSVTLTVGANVAACQTIVRDVSLSWGIPAEIKVIRDMRQCQLNLDEGIVSLGLPYHCKVLLRFLDERHAWIPDVTVGHVAGRPSPASDRYGRVMLEYRSDQPGPVIAEKKGFFSENINLSCLAERQIQERLIILKTNKEVR